MADIKKLNDDFSTAGQITPDDLKQSAEEGFKSVLNVRSPDETGVLADEQQQAEAVGLRYQHPQLLQSLTSISGLHLPCRFNHATRSGLRLWHADQSKRAVFLNTL